MPPSTRKPSHHAFTGSAELNAMVERVAPSILELLGDGLPRTKPAIVEALAGRHDKQDVVHALIRLAVTDQVQESGGRRGLLSASGRAAHAASGRPPGPATCLAGTAPHLGLCPAPGGGHGAG